MAFFWEFTKCKFKTLYLCISASIYLISSDFIHTQQGVSSDDIYFDANDPITSDPDFQSLINNIYDRNIRRGLSNPSTLSIEDKQLILDLHNKIRSETARGLYEGPGGTYQPSACNMNALSWSNALEKVATDWSEQCYFEHSSGCATRLSNAINEGYSAEWNVNPNNMDGCGENLYISGAPPAMNAMYNNKNYGILGGIERGWSKDESLLYAYSNKFSYAAGHYTQMIWANTRYVGCGFRQCNGITTKSSSYSWGKLMFTCNYYPPGNYNQYPYKEGDACSCCDGDRKVCTHDNGLCGGGWNKNWNNNYVGNSAKQEVDACYDGLGRNVCQENGQDNFADATDNPTKDPSANPSSIPSKVPTNNPTITHVEPPNDPEQSVIVYAVRVSTEVIWLTYSYDFENVQAVIEELMFEGLAEPYFGLSGVNIDADSLSKQGPFCANPCDYVYGFNTVPMVLQGASLEEKNTMVESVENGEYAAAFCEKLTQRYKRPQGDGLRCYKITASVESITESEYQEFIGDGDVDEIVFDALNLETYSTMELFVLICCLCVVCFICWCVGWYAHKRRFKKELERELSVAASYDAQEHEEKIRRQIAATGGSGQSAEYQLTPTKRR